MAPAEPNHKPFEIQGEAPVFEEEREGWKGYIEWERYPEKKKKAAEVLAKYDFPVVGTHQLFGLYQRTLTCGSLLSFNLSRCPRRTLFWKVCAGSKSVCVPRSNGLLMAEQILPLCHGQDSAGHAR